MLYVIIIITITRKRHKVSPHSSSSALHSSSPSDGPSRKRGGSPTTSLSAAAHSPTALLPVQTDLLPPRKRIMPTTRSGISPEAIKEVIAQRVAEALAANEANRNIRKHD
ncbi:hypothetical protein Tco_1377073 [Tanacetum coccineum]